MNRGHNREEYLDRIRKIRELMPDCGISMDMISGFPTETEEDHQETLSLMEAVKYDFGYMFHYSERPGTMAARKFEDDIAQETKNRRLREVIELQQKHSLERNKKHIGKTEEVLVEGTSKKSDEHWFGRNTQNTVVVFPKSTYQPGDFVKVKITDCTSATLIGTLANESQ